MFNPLAPFLETNGRIILDGALATELERHGADLNDPLWSARVLLEAPQIIRRVHLDYFHAGADCATTASYQATIAGFARRGLSEAEALDLIRLSVRLAQEARDEFWAAGPHPGRLAPFIAGSVGSYGAFLADGSEYRGGYGLSQQALADFHRPRIAALLEAGVDILACETIPALSEAQALAGLLAEFPDAAAWISFSARDGRHTGQGEPLSEAAALLDGCAQVVAIGVNCTAPRFIPELIGEIRKGSAKPVVVYPNSGEIYDAASNTWSGETDVADYGQQARTWFETGARIIGGCCRTGPEHIRAVVTW